jgi:hypothetical protein
MSIEYSVQYTNAFRVKPAVMNDSVDWHGRKRIAFFEHTQAVQGEDGSEVYLVRLPAGKVRVLRNLSFISISALGASRTVDVGYAAHVASDGSAVNASVDHFIDGLDASSATNKTLFDQDDVTVLTSLFDSKEGVDIVLTVDGDTLDAGETFQGYITYVKAD